MTLAKFQLYTKLSLIVIGMCLYGVATYSLGVISASNNLAKVKGVSTKVKEDPIEKPLPYSDIQSAKVIGSSVKLCSNTQAGFELSYPNDWFTTYNSDDHQCTFFAPYTFVLPQSIDDGVTPVKIEVVKPDSWDGTVKFYENPNEFNNVKTAQNLAGSGRSVKRIETESTGTGSIPSGFTAVYFLVFDAKSPLVVSYTQRDQKDDVVKNEKVVGDMVESLKFF